MGETFEIEKSKPTGHELAAWLMTGVAMLLVLKLQLLPVLLSGMLVYELVHVLSRPLRIGRLRGLRARVVVVSLLAIMIMSLLSLLIWGIIVFVRGESGNIPLLLKKMAEIIEGYREALPVWMKGYLPGDPEVLREGIVLWLRDHAREVQVVGKEAGLVTVHVLIGMVVGVLLSLREVVSAHECRPLAQALSERAERFGTAFRFVVFAQVRIAALNALFAAIYLGVLLPLFGIHLPLVKTMVVITFITGLLPVIGNVISNTIIVIVSLSYSLSVAGASLGFLIVIHKLEYFLNARIIGARIHAHAWELLIVMIAMEAAFGIAGVIAAPIYYAYIKSELAERGLV
jgi:predicted PurR-regulated permease PerM